MGSSQSEEARTETELSVPDERGSISSEWQELNHEEYYESFPRKDTEKRAYQQDSNDALQQNHNHGVITDKAGSQPSNHFEMVSAGGDRLQIPPVRELQNHVNLRDSFFRGIALSSASGGVKSESVADTFFG